MWSQYLRVKEREGVVALFHELHPNPLFCSQEDWRRLQENAEEMPILHDALKERKLLIDRAEEDESESQHAKFTLERKLKQTTILYLMTAQDCNFGCGYCPVPEIARKYGGTRLTQRNAQLGINLWFQHIRDEYDPSLEYFVIFYGGEPLLNSGVIVESVKYLEERKASEGLPRNLNVMIATNGSLLTDGLIAFCKSHNIMVAVGLDGPQAVNDVLRVDTAGKGTFDTIVSGIRRLVSAGVRTFASVSVTPANLPLIAGYGSFFRQLGIEKFGFNFLKGKLLRQLVGEDGIESYYREASRCVVEQTRRDVAGFEYQMEKKQAAFDRQEFFPVDCTCYGNQLVVQPDGELSHCPFVKPCLGKVGEVDAGFRIWDQQIVKEWQQRLSPSRSGDAKALDGGGCAWSSIELWGDTLATDRASQIFAEEVLNEFIWSLYDRQRTA